MEGNATWIVEGGLGQGVREMGGGVQTPHWPPTATPTADECSEGNRGINAHTTLNKFILSVL